MLTTQLVRVRLRSGTITPTWIDPGKASLRDSAAALAETVAEAAEQGWTRGELVAALGEQTAGSRSVKLLRGLEKLLLDGCTFDVDCPVPPAQLRAAAFAASAAVGPLALEEGEGPTAREVLAGVAEELGITVEAAEAALYGDLKDAQVLTAAKVPEPEALLHRYNVSLVQAVLLRASRVVVRLTKPSPPRVRQLLRWAKFRQLMHEARHEGEDLVLALDGPASMFSHTTRYGLALATFFPALLLQDGAWTMTADVVWGPQKRPATLTVDHTQGLVSHLADTGAYTTREQSWFVERWEAAKDNGWTMSDQTLPIELGGRGVVLPDLTFTKGKRTAHLEIIGFWRRDYLQRRLEGLRRHGPGNLVLAVSKKLVTAKEGLDDFEGAIVPFASVVPVKAVVAALEEVAR